MKFTLMIYQGTTPLPGTEAWEKLPKAQQKSIYAEYAQLNNTPGLTPGLPLGHLSSAKTVKVREGKPQVKDGTYLTEAVAGYATVEAENIEDAIAIATRIPAARLGGAVEVRPEEVYW